MYKRLNGLAAATTGPVWQKALGLSAAVSTVIRVIARSHHKPHAGHTVPSDFAGICAASFAESACNTLMVEQLETLGVRQVRIDYTYDSPDSQTDQLLSLLCDNGFAVCLHLVQPPERAAQMHTFAARMEWARFVRLSLRRWAPQLEAVEIGSTVNRRRWAGYDVPGFLYTWQIATREVRRWPLRYAGPNVTDFEPLYNAGLLSWFRKTGTLPDVHTNNLFVERIIEPEAFDPRVGGRYSRRLLRLNLIKKARVLQTIGSRNQVPELWCSHVSWTAPRIRRFIDDADQKQADYLSRYFVLAAASGAISRVYWGALVCVRAGLLDDLTGVYPDHERVTLYDKSYGAADSCAVYPAFHALQAINRHIAGARYRGSLGPDENLQIHAFSNDTSQIQVVWTTNARVAELRTIYSTADLAQAQYVGRDGDILAEAPQIASEAPLYLIWPLDVAVTINAAARPLPALSIHRHASGLKYYIHSSSDLTAMLVAADVQQSELLLTALSPQRLTRSAESRVLRDARNAIWVIEDPRNPQRSLVVKQPVRLRAYKKIYQRMRPSKARQSWNGACELLRRGISTPQPVAFLEFHGAKAITSNFYICEMLADAIPARRYLAAYASGAASFEGISATGFYQQLSSFVGQMHNRGVYFRDLSSGNILVRSGDVLEFSLVDTARARFFNRPSTVLQRLSDLKRLCFKMSWAHREEFMRLYMEGCGIQESSWHRLAFVFYDFKINTKRRLLGRRRRGTAETSRPIGPPGKQSASTK